jgi:hypothetical protein
VSLISILADLSGIASAIDRNTLVQTRIAEALERLSPPLQIDIDERIAHTAVDDGFHLAESPEEYRERTSSEAELAISLGVAPWSPAFQKAISEMRNGLMRPRMVTDEEGKLVAVPGLDEAAASQAVRDAFAQARAQENERKG